MLRLGARGVLAATLLVLAPLSPAQAGFFKRAYFLPPVASYAPETLVALAAIDDTLVYGSSAEDEPGAAALFGATSGNLLKSLTNPGAVRAYPDDFGGSVAIDDRVVAVGAIGKETVHLYNRRGVLQRDIANPQPGSNYGFGMAVGLAGSTVVVGAPSADTGGTGAGAVFLFDIQDGHLIRAIYGTVADGALGAAVAGVGSHVLAGAPGTSQFSGAAGVLISFDARTGDEEWRTSAPTPSAGDRFGAAIAAKRGRVLVGAPYGDDQVADSGAAYVLRAKDGGILRTIRNPTGRADHFGTAVAMGGGLLAVGAPAADAVEQDTGLAHVFTAAGRLIQSFDPEPRTYCYSAGTAVAVGANFVAVGTVDCFGDSGVTTYTLHGPRLDGAARLPTVVP